MQQDSFQDRISRIQAKQTHKPRKRQRGSFCVVFTATWLGLFAAVAGLWHTGAVDLEKVADLMPDAQQQTAGIMTPNPGKAAKPVAERNDGARWARVGETSQSRQFFTLSTKGNAQHPTRTGGIVGYMQMQVSREKLSQNSKGGRLGFEGQNALSDRSRDKFWER